MPHKRGSVDRVGWRRNVPGERQLAESWAANGYPAELPSPQLWEHPNGMQAFVAREWAGGRPTDPVRWHVSVRGPGRVPTWNEMVDAAHALRPGVCFVVAVPPRTWWMNLHPHVLHLWETADEALIAEWRANARGDRVTA